jgi:zinc protease
MINSRLSDMASKPDAPFAGASVYDGVYLVANTKGAFTASAVAKTDIKASLEAVYREVLRAKRHGFVATEYLRSRDEYLSVLERQYKNRNKIESNRLVEEYVEHFLDNEPIPGIETEYQLMNMIAKQIPVEAVTQTFQQLFSTDKNVVVMAVLPDKPEIAMPTEAELAEIMAKVDAEEIAPFVDNVKQDPLIPELPAKGAIVKESVNKEFDAKEWILSNGAKVVLKKTDFKEDEILFGATAMGGTSVYPESEACNLQVLEMAARQISLGTFTSSDLEKYMAGKQVGVSISVSDYTKGLVGSSTPKDLKTLMELVYMTFVGAGLDADEYQATVSSISAILKQQESTPQFVFQSKRLEVL